MIDGCGGGWAMADGSGKGGLQPMMGGSGRYKLK